MTGGTLLVTRDRLAELGERHPKLRTLRGAPIVIGSSVTVHDLNDPRHTGGNMTAARNSAQRGVPRVYAVDNSSKALAGVVQQLEDAGAIVVVIDHDTEGGTAKPYFIVSQLVDHFAGENTLFVKAEGDKDIAKNPQNIAKLSLAARANHVITCGRSLGTFQSMAPYQRVTEGAMAPLLALIAGTPYDPASGVIALTSQGREAFYRFTGTDWTYLLLTPHTAALEGLSVGGVTMSYTYHPDMVTAENNPETEAKRRNQLGLMANAAVEVAGGYDELSMDKRQAYNSLMAVLDGLEALAQQQVASAPLPVRTLRPGGPGWGGSAITPGTSTSC